MLSRLRILLSLLTRASKPNRDSGRSEEAQMHVMEVMIGGLLIVAALQAGIAMTQPSGQQESGTSELRSLGTDALRTLYYLPILNGTSGADGAVNPDDFQNSTLVLSAMGNRTDILTDFMNVTLPQRISYRISMERYLPANGTVTTETMILHRGPDVLGETARAHFLFQSSGVVYDVQLLMWFLSREVPV